MHSTVGEVGLHSSYDCVSGVSYVGAAAWIMNNEVGKEAFAGRSLLFVGPPEQVHIVGFMLLGDIVVPKYFAIQIEY